tara:strand:+ start:2225 stop:2590 length:366 start_codon:yes stop_codon:yes gene_type:complete
MKTKKIVKQFIKEDLELDICKDELSEILENLEMEVDFFQEIDGCEYRFIWDEEIWDIYVKEIKSIVEDSYDINAPDWLAIDWEQTAENCSVDSYGNTFNSYDGGEELLQLADDNWYVFRIY